MYGISFYRCLCFAKFSHAIYLYVCLIACNDSSAFIFITRRASYSVSHQLPFLCVIMLLANCSHFFACNEHYVLVFKSPSLNAFALILKVVVMKALFDCRQHNTAS